MGYVHSPETLHHIAAYLNLAPPLDCDKAEALDPALLLEILVAKHERRVSQSEKLNSTPLYPTEEMLWDEGLVPTEYYNGEG